MAANNTATDCATGTLVAATEYSIELTDAGRKVEVIHHGGAVTNVVYYKLFTAEPTGATMTGAGADNEFPLLAGERLMIDVPRKASGSIWVEFISAGAATVSAVLVPSE